MMGTHHTELLLSHYLVYAVILGIACQGYCHRMACVMFLEPWLCGVKNSCVAILSGQAMFKFVEIFMIRFQV